MLVRILGLSIKCALGGAALLYLSKREVFEARARLLDAECSLESGELVVTVGNSIKLLRLSLKDGFRLSIIDVMSASDINKIRKSVIGGTMVSFLRLFFGAPVIKALEAAEIAIRERMTDEDTDEEQARKFGEQLQGIAEAKKIFGA